MSTGSEEYNCDFLTLQKYALSQEEKKRAPDTTVGMRSEIQISLA